MSKTYRVRVETMTEVDVISPSKEAAHEDAVSFVLSREPDFISSNIVEEEL